MQFSTGWHENEMSTEPRRGTEILLSSLSLVPTEPIAVRLSPVLATRPEILD